MTEPDPYVDLGRSVRRARLVRGLSRRELAEQADISAPYVAKIENGERKPQAPVLHRLAAALDVSPSSLLSGDDLPDADRRTEAWAAADSRTWRRTAEPLTLGAVGAAAALPAPAPTEPLDRDLLAELLGLAAHADSEHLRAAIRVLRQGQVDPF